MKRNLPIFIAAIIFTLSCSQEQSKNKKDEGKVQLSKVCDNIMDRFSRGNYSEAMNVLKQHSLLGNEAIDSLKLTIEQQMSNLDYRYGKAVSFEHVEDRSIQQLITKRTYLLLFEGNYLRFDFTLYESPKFGWKITTFEYTPEIDNLFK